MDDVQTMLAEREKYRQEPECFIFSDKEGRVMTFGGLLMGMLAAREGTPGWHRGFILAEMLGIKPKPLYGYTGSLEH